MLSHLTLAAGLIFADPDPAALRALMWEARPILIFAVVDDPRLARQIARFEAAEPALTERDNVLVIDTDPDSALRARYRPGAFTVILIGKDGGEKLRRDGLVEPATLVTLIDTMPMRRQEMQRRAD